MQYTYFNTPPRYKQTWTIQVWDSILTVVALDEFGKLLKMVTKLSKERMP